MTPECSRFQSTRFLGTSDRYEPRHKSVEASCFVSWLNASCDFLVTRVGTQCRTSLRETRICQVVNIGELFSAELRGSRSLQVYKLMMFPALLFVLASSKSFHQPEQVPHSVH